MINDGGEGLWCCELSEMVEFVGEVGMLFDFGIVWSMIICLGSLVILVKILGILLILSLRDWKVLLFGRGIFLYCVFLFCCELFMW